MDDFCKLPQCCGATTPASLCSDCKTMAIERLQRERDALQAFKDYVHQRLDEAGVPTHPDGEHSKAGCRIGDRLDIVLRERDEAIKAKNHWLDELNAVEQIMLDAGAPEYDADGNPLGERGTARALVAQRDEARAENEKLLTILRAAAEPFRADYPDEWRTMAAHRLRTLRAALGGEGDR